MLLCCLSACLLADMPACLRAHLPVCLPAGMLEAFSYVVRMFSGVISDKMTSRKASITAGFAMGAMAKFGMSGATTTASLFVTKAIDRLGNGVQVRQAAGALSPRRSVRAGRAWCAACTLGVCARAWRLCAGAHACETADALPLQCAGGLWLSAAAAPAARHRAAVGRVLACTGQNV